MLELPKILIHEHLDCSVRPETMLDLWSKIGFEKAPPQAFPQESLKLWQESLNQRDSNKASELRKQAAALFAQNLQEQSSKSLAQYVQAIVEYILPVMQTKEELRRITKERIEDAVKDGIIAMELRFAPQLHTLGSPADGNVLSLDEVMAAIIEATNNSPIPVKLGICTLRHQPDSLCEQLVELAIKYRPHVGFFDLAADEAAHPGVLPWWASHIEKLRENGMKITCHLWETDNPTAKDIEAIHKYNLKRLGHGIRVGETPGLEGVVFEVCPTSNIVTGQISSMEKHPINAMYKAGRLVTVNTDGTLLTGTTLSKEYEKVAKCFSWTAADFLATNLNALAASSFDDNVKQKLSEQLKLGYAASSRV